VSQRSKEGFSSRKEMDVETINIDTPKLEAFRGA